MATHDRRESSAIADGLNGLPSSYNFYQAVRLLVAANDSDQNAIDVLDQTIKFVTEAGDQFAGSDIYSIDESQHQTLMTLATFGLTGPLGPMPQQHSFRIEAQARSGDDALKKFLGLFEHRLISLLYLVKQKNCIGLHNGLRTNSDQYRYLYQLSGLPRISNHQQGSHYGQLLPFAGLLAGGKVSAAGLSNILSTVLDTSVRVSSLKGAFVPLDSNVQARLSSAAGASHGATSLSRLGQSVSLGGRIWNQSYGIDLEIGPVDWETANRWMVGESAYAKLVDLLLYTTNGQWQLETKIRVKEETIPISRLSNETRLGLNSWLKSKEGDQAYRLTRRTIKPRHFH